MAELFGTDGIRGLAGTPPVDVETGLRLGRALIEFCRRRGRDPHIVIGRDTRISGEMLEHAVVSGALSAGGAVSRAGEIPTPAIAFLARTLGLGAGIVISASHNPYEYNGFKVFTGEGFKLSEAEESEIEELIFRKEAFEDKRDPGRVVVLEEARDLYLSFLRKTLPEDFTLRDMKVVLDCANGATFRVAPALFERLGAAVTATHMEPDGKNINLECGSQYTERLSRRVLEEGAEIGLAFDGDGDRLIAVDEKGRTLTGDQLLTIYAKMLRDGDALRQNVVVSTVMSNMGFRLALKDLGIEQVAAKVGDRFVMEEMRAREAVLGGEDSGHIIFLGYHTTGDGLISALQILRALRTFHQPLSELSRLMTVFPQVLKNVPVSKKEDLSRVPVVAGEIARVESALGERGRVLVRFSGTEPVCRVMVEGEEREEIEEYANRIAGKIIEALGYN